MPVPAVRPHRLGEARGLHLYEADGEEIRASTYVWREGDWGLTLLHPRFVAPPGVRVLPLKGFRKLRVMLYWRGRRTKVPAPGRLSQ